MTAVHARSTRYNDVSIDSALLWLPGFNPGSGHVGFVVEKVKLGQVFSEYFRFTSQFSFYQLLHIY
jgi:hypothetical protein